jgi:histidyl-tRNA synthetase
MCKVDLSIIRGFEYYTGVVFEAFDAERELRSLFGGGRYDTLAGMFGSREVPAIGFAFGYSTTVELLKKEDRWPIEEPAVDVYVLTVSDSVRGHSLEVAEQLRSQGLSVETDLSGRGFGEQLSYADRINASRTVIVGEKDLEDDRYTVKHMESGEEEHVPVDELVEHLVSEGAIVTN